MCGIAGILLRDGASVDREQLERMGRIQAHRGPDGHDIYLQGCVGLAHRRLAILDLSEAGHQPLLLEDHALVYNGEIYNFQELRTELEGFGHRFRSDCDTEVLLRAYLQWGEKCVERFNGMFAFALWKNSDQTLFCARDRLGIKPFFYFQDQTRFEFASEIKALLFEPSRRRPNLRPLVRFLGEGLVGDEDETFFRDVKVLPAAHTLTVSPSGVRLRRYWKLQVYSDWQSAHRAAKVGPSTLQPGLTPAVSQGRLPHNPELTQASEAFREIFVDSVKLRLRSDVPVGTCLSGGLDSSSVVAAASSLLDRPVETFSSLYPDTGYNERQFVDSVVETFGTKPHPVEPNGQDLPEIFDKIVWHQDEPSAGPGLYSQWRVMETARESVTVLLDGQGGDELLAGYHHYFRQLLTEEARRIKSERGDFDELRALAKVIAQVTGSPHHELAEQAIRRAKRPGFLKIFHRDRPGRVKPPAIFNRELGEQLRREDLLRTPVEKLFSDSLNQKLYADLTRFSIPTLLRYEDRNSMAFSLEARVPFLDHRLVEFCFALPYRFKIDPPQTKLILRQAMNGILPPSVVDRQDKLGYPTPMAHWFRGHLKDWAEDILESQAFRECELLDAGACREVWRQHLSGQDQSWGVWRILCCFRWSQLFLQGEGFAPELIGSSSG